MHIFRWMHFLTYTHALYGCSQMYKCMHEHLEPTTHSGAEAKCTDTWIFSSTTTHTHTHTHTVRTWSDSSHTLAHTERCRTTNTHAEHLCNCQPILIGPAIPVQGSNLLSYPSTPPPPPPSPPPSSKHFWLLFCPLPTSSVFLFWLQLSRPFSLCLSAGDPEFPSNMTSQRGLSVSPSRSTLTFFPLLLSSVRPSPACLCSPLHQVRGTEGWDLQQRVLLSRGFDQTQSQERSLTDC